jgi:hypothetical protein
VREAEEIGERDFQYRPPIVIDGKPVVDIGPALFQRPKLGEVFSGRVRWKVFPEPSVDRDLKATFAIEATV